MTDIFVAKEKKALSHKPTSSKPIPPELDKELEEEKYHSWTGKLHPLTSIAFKPNLHFDDQEPDEQIILFVRPHLITNLKWFLLTILLGLVPPLALGFLDLSFIPLNFRLIGFLAWYLLLFAFAFERFLVWFFNVEMITNKRIIDVNIPSILMRDISQTPLENIQDITTETAGFMRSLLSFGDVRIQTAGAVPEIKFEGVPHPNKVSQILNDLWRKL